MIKNDPIYVRYERIMEEKKKKEEENKRLRENREAE
jgi:hypothetical protein